MTSENSPGQAMERMLQQVPEEYTTTRRMIEQLRADAMDDAAPGISEEAFAAAALAAVLSLEMRVHRLESD